jgi:hypothetical protein
MADGIKARIWVGDNNTNTLGYALGLLRQVRCDLFVNKERQFSVVPMFTENIPSTSYMRQIQEMEVMEGTLNLSTDKKNVFTSADCTYAFVPALNGSAVRSDKFENQKAIQFMNGETAKTIEFPNLYRKDDAELQLEEMVRFYSGTLETIKVNVGWLHINAELGDFVSLSLPLATTPYSISNPDYDPITNPNAPEKIVKHFEMFQQIPCQIRSISVEPNGGSMEMEFLSFANYPLPYYLAEVDPTTEEDTKFAATCPSSYNQVIEH